MPPLEYLKAFVLNTVFFAVAIAVYVLYMNGQPGGPSTEIVILLVVASLALTATRLRALLPTTARLGYTDRERFLKTLDAAVNTRDRWAIVEASETGRVYTARVTVGLYTASLPLTVTLSGGRAVLFGPPRAVRHIQRIMIPMGAAQAVE